tara:strand:- start:196 stop:2112 length:1917 start_codon:yes stop_codon:yes gene_type:complete
MSKKIRVDEAAERLTGGDHDDFIEFAGNHLKIQTKSGDFIPFALNKSQLMREGLITEMERAGLPVRIWEAKARQLGCSTHVQGRMFWKSITNQDETALVAAHTEPSVRAIFTKCKVFYDYLPSDLRPMTRYNNVYELDFRAPQGAAGLRSRFIVMTAKSVDDARGFTARQVHCSEVAFYKRPEEFFLATLQAVPDEVGTMIYAESTCNGSGDFHHTQYLAANVWWDEIPPWMELKKKHPGHPDSTWYALFTPWFLMEEYTRKLQVDEAVFEKSLDRDEKILLEKFGDWISFENLQWRRETIVSKCGGSLDRFHQEYPSTDEEAFSTTGSPVFDKTAIWEQVRENGCPCQMCAKKLRIGDNNECPEHGWYEIVDGSGMEPGRQRIFSSYSPEVEKGMDGNGRFSIWQTPEHRRRYVVSADVSKGPSSRDWDHVVVMDVASMTQVAEWRGKVDLDVLAETVLLIAIYYNNAVLAPESSGLGAGLVAMLGQTKYWNMYRRQSPDRLGGPTSTFGWDTNRKTKPEMVGLMQKALKDGYIRIRSQRVLEEMLAYRSVVKRNPDGHDVDAKMTAPAGKNDDACIAMMIANAVAHYCPGSGADVKGDGPAASSGDHNKWSPDEWDQYEDWTKKFKARVAAGQRRK